MACKIVDLDEAAHKLTESSGSGAAGEGWNEQIRRLARGKELVMREIRILSKLSHVSIAKPQSFPSILTHLSRTSSISRKLSSQVVLCE